MKNVHPPSPCLVRNPTLAFENWLRTTVPDGDPVARRQATSDFTTRGMLIHLGFTRDVSDEDAQDLFDAMVEVDRAADEYEEANRAPAKYHFRRADLADPVQARLHGHRSVVEFVEDKDTGLFLAQETKVIGGPFRRDELPSYDEAVE